MNLQLLKRLPLLRDLEQEQLETLAGFLEEEIFEMGRDILVEHGNEENTKMYIIFEGAAEVLKKAPSRSEEEISLNILKAGETFGEMALVDIMVRSATVRAIRTTRVYSLSRENMEKIFDDHPHIFGRIMRNIAKQISRRLRKADAFQASVLYKEAKQKEENEAEELKEEDILDDLPTQEIKQEDLPKTETETETNSSNEG